MLALAAKGLITPEYTTYSLDKALDAYADMDAGRLTGRAVITPVSGRRAARRARSERGIRLDEFPVSFLLLQ